MSSNSRGQGPSRDPFPPNSNMPSAQNAQGHLREAVPPAQPGNHAYNAQGHLREAGQSLQEAGKALQEAGKALQGNHTQNVQRSQVGTIFAQSPQGQNQPLSQNPSMIPSQGAQQPAQGYHAQGSSAQTQHGKKASTGQARLQEAAIPVPPALHATAGLHKGWVTHDQFMSMARQLCDSHRARHGEKALMPTIPPLQAFPHWDGVSDIPLNTRSSFGLPPSSNTPGYLNGRRMSAEKRRRLNDPVRCGRCNKEGHTLAECVAWPAKNTGDMFGCPVCNSSDHRFDDCYAVRGYLDVEPMSERDKFFHLVVKRQGKPMLRTDITFERERYAELANDFGVVRPPLTRNFVIRLLHKKEYNFKDYNYADNTPRVPDDPDSEKASELTEQGFKLWKDNRVNRPIDRRVYPADIDNDDDVNMGNASADPGQNPGKPNQMD